MKKIITSFLIIITALLLTGCDGFKDLEINLDIDLDVKPVLKGYYPNSGMSNTEFGNSYTTRMSEELTGYKVEYSQDASGNQKQAIENALISKADYSFFKLEVGSYEGIVGDLALLDLAPYLEKFGPDLLEIIPQEAWDSVTIDGRIYGIPEISFSGYGMQDEALVWNLSHLEAVGITKIPETISEIDTALEKLDAKYSSTNNNYSAFGLAGSSAMCNILSSAFEIPNQFFEDENGIIQPYIYHENYENYLAYLRSYVMDGYLFESWQGKQAVDVQTNLSNGNHSVAFLSYWNINNLVDAYVTANKSSGITEEEARANFGYSLRIKGDGSNGSIPQEEGRIRAAQSIGYYISIPAYQYDIGGYVVDWANERIKAENYEIITSGVEDVHYTTVTADTPGAIEINYNGETSYRTLLPQYNIDIEPNSMYATGVHPDVSRAYWACREASYNCWEILFPLDDTIIDNPISMSPYLPGWASISITARSWIITYEQRYTVSKTDAEAQKSIEYLQRVYKTNYWTTSVANEVQNWYSTKETK